MKLKDLNNLNDKIDVLNASRLVINQLQSVSNLETIQYEEDDNFDGSPFVSIWDKTHQLFVSKSNGAIVVEVGEETVTLQYFLDNIKYETN